MINGFNYIVCVFLLNTPSCDTVFKYISSKDTINIYSEDIIKIDSIGICQFHFYLSEGTKEKMQSIENEAGNLFFYTEVGRWETVKPLNFYAQEIPLGYSVMLSRSESYIHQEGYIDMTIRIPPWKDVQQPKDKKKKTRKQKN